jgi:trehalose 6-phosphate synthase
MWSSAKDLSPPLRSEIEYACYYLGYANSVLWPVFHNRLDLAKFEAGFFEYYVETNRRLCRLLQPLLRPDDIVWVHDYHLIPFAAELRRRSVANAIGFYLHIPFPPWQTFMAVPEHRELARMLTAYDLIGVQTQADVANLLDYMSNGVDGRIVPDGRSRVFERLVSIASFPVGIDMTDFAKAKRSASRAQDVSGEPVIGRPPDYTKAAAEVRSRLRYVPPPTPGRAHPNRTADAGECEAHSDIRHELETLRIYQRPLGRPTAPIHYIVVSHRVADPATSIASGMMVRADGTT